jgi:hypothetical protein
LVLVLLAEKSIFLPRKVNLVLVLVESVVLLAVAAFAVAVWAGVLLLEVERESVWVEVPVFSSVAVVVGVQSYFAGEAAEAVSLLYLPAWEVAELALALVSEGLGASFRYPYLLLSLSYRQILSEDVLPAAAQQIHHLALLFEATCGTAIS